MCRKSIFYWVIIFCLILTACSTKAEQMLPVDEYITEIVVKEATEEVIAVETDIEDVPTEVLFFETNINIDGDAADWEGYEILQSDVEGDASDGGFDIASVRAFTNDAFLYLLIETYQPPTDFLQVDLEIDSGSKKYIVSFPSVGDASIGDISEGEYESLGGISGSQHAVAGAVEFKMPLAVLNDVKDIEIQVRPMAGECCAYPAWYAVDELPSFKPIQIDEVEPARDLTLPPPAAGASLAVQQNLEGLHCDEPSDMAVTADGNTVYIVCGNTDLVMSVDVESRQVTAVLPIHEEAENPYGPAPRRVAITPDDSMLLVNNEIDQSMTIIDTKSFEVITTLKTGSGGFRPAISPDGRVAYDVGGEPPKVSVIDLDSLEITATILLPVQRPYAVTFSADGEKAYVGSMDGKIMRIDVANQQISGQIYLPQAGWYGDLVLTQDDSKAYFCSVREDWIIEIDLEAMKMLRRFDVKKPESLLLSADESRIYFGTFGSFLEGVYPVGVLDLESGDLVGQIQFVTPAPHVSWTPDIEALVFVGDGSHIFAPGVDSDGIFIIDTDRLEQIAFIPLTDFAVLQPDKLVIEPDGNRLFTANIAPQAASLSVVDAANGEGETYFFMEEKNECFGQATSLDIVPDGSMVYLSTDSCILEFDNKAMGFAASHKLDIRGSIRDLAVHPDEKVVYIVDSSGCISEVDMDTFEILEVIKTVEEGHNIKVSPDGSRVYVTGSRQYAALDTASNHLLAMETVHEGGGEQFTAYPDRLIGIPTEQDFYLIGAFEVIQVYEATTNQLIRVIDLEPWAPTRTLASDAVFLPDGSRGYLSLWDLKGIAVFDPQTWQLVAQIDTGYDPVYGVCPNDLAVSPDGSRLYVSGEQSDNILVIDTVSNEIIDEFWLAP